MSGDVASTAAKASLRGLILGSCNLQLLALACGCRYKIDDSLSSSEDKLRGFTNQSSSDSLGWIGTGQSYLEGHRPTFVSALVPSLQQ